MPKTSRARTDRVILIVFGLAIIALYIASYFLTEIKGVGFNNLVSAIRFLVDKSFKPLIFGLIFGTFLDQIFPNKYRSFLLSGSGVKPIFNATWIGIFSKRCTYQHLHTGIIQNQTGVSVGATVAYLISSTFNSSSLIFLLLSLYGISKGLLLISSLFIIAFLSGVIFDLMSFYKFIPKSDMISRVNPNFNIYLELKNDFQVLKSKFNFLLFIKEDFFKFFVNLFINLKLSLKWYFIGILLSGLIVGGLGEELISTFNFHYYLVIVVILIFSLLIELLDEGLLILAFTIYHFTGQISFALLITIATVICEYVELPEIKKNYGQKFWVLFGTIPVILALIIGLFIK